jgi:Polyketide cyclase / dehydrase and lipid transport
MSSTVTIRESIEITMPPAAVWEAIADYGFDLKWRKGLTQMAPDPVGPAAMGTKIHEVVVTSGREYVADTIVTEFHAGTSYRFTGEGTIGKLSGSRSVEPRGETASVFTYGIELTPRGKMRLLRPILGPMVRSNLRKDLVRLKGLLERPLTG